MTLVIIKKQIIALHNEVYFTMSFKKYKGKIKSILVRFLIYNKIFLFNIGILLVLIQLVNDNGGELIALNSGFSFSLVVLLLLTLLILGVIAVLKLLESFGRRQL